ncbi:MAG: enhanced intracellular survival protein Eis [Haloarculaceae archaeon]
MDYRSVPDGDIPSFVRLLSYAFRLPEGPHEDPPDRPWDQVGERRALYDGEDLVAGCVRMDFEARLRGSRTPLGGVAGVASDPGRRRQGHTRRLLAALLAEYRDDGVPLAALHPFSRSFYGDLGWATCERLVRFELDPGALAPAGLPHDEFRRVTADDAAALGAVRDRAMAGRSLTSDRTPEWWRWFVFHRWGEDRYARACVRDGDVCGYVTYGVREAGGDRVLSVDELVGVDEDARRRLYWFLSNHDSQIDQVELPRPDARLQDRLETDDATAELRRGGMARATDVAGALTAVPYPDGVAGEVVLAVRDEVAPWNDGQIRLLVEDGAGTCEPAPDAEPDATVDVGTLSQLLVGYHDVAAVERLGGLSVADEAARSCLAAAFPETAVGPLDAF